MGFADHLAVLTGKSVSWISKTVGLGAGGTWSGEIALWLNPRILSSLISHLRKGVILVAGTNGKTTTALMIKHILENNGESVVHNASGANLENGIVSALIQNLNADYGVFEVDENALPIVTEHCHSGSMIIVLLNLFRDQLDRYGEVDVIAEKWGRALKAISHQRSAVSKTKTVHLIANADDPLIVSLASRPGLEATFFGLDTLRAKSTVMEHATDSMFCSRCGARLQYNGIFFSHLGLWRCPNCGEKRPNPNVSKAGSPLPGLYNQYNTLAATAVAKVLKKKVVLDDFQPSFGRQEEIRIKGKSVKIFLSKNPVGFNQSLRTVLELGARKFLFVLNDRIPDGRDVSWIWDVDFEMLPNYITPVVSGDRAYDMAVRLKYAKPYHRLPKGAVSEPQTPILVYEDLPTSIAFCLENLIDRETLYILPTYSAMLEVRKILTGRRIL